MNEVNCIAIRHVSDYGVTGFADCSMRLTRKGRGNYYYNALLIVVWLCSIGTTYISYRKYHLLV